MKRQPWYKATWRRAVLDVHITDEDERFLASRDYVRLGAARVRGVRQLPEGMPLDRDVRGGVVSFTIPRLETLAMVSLDCE